MSSPVRIIRRAAKIQVQDSSGARWPWGYANEAVYVIDPLGAETPEMRAERKPSLGIAHVLSIVATMLVVAALFTVVGAFYGASDPDAVKDLMPSVPSLSGERAEPKEGAR